MNWSQAIWDAPTELKFYKVLIEVTRIDYIKAHFYETVVTNSAEKALEHFEHYKNTYPVPLELKMQVVNTAPIVTVGVLPVWSEPDSVLPGPSRKMVTPWRFQMMIMTYGLTWTHEHYPNGFED